MHLGEMVSLPIEVEDLLVPCPGRLLFDAARPRNLERVYESARRSRRANHPREKLARDALPEAARGFPFAPPWIRRLEIVASGALSVVLLRPRLAKIERQHGGEAIIERCRHSGWVS